MKLILVFLAATFFTLTASSQNKSLKSNPDPAKKLLLVEASCGECNFKMKGKGCNLAIRMDGKSYYVDGTSIDDHGDAHGEDGFCEAVRKADVQGEIVNNRFHATYFKLRPKKEKEDK